MTANLSKDVTNLCCAHVYTSRMFGMAVVPRFGRIGAWLVALQAMVSAQAVGAVTEVWSDFGGLWSSSAASLNATQPDNSHNLLAFRFNGTVYSTGVDDAKLSANGVSFTPGNWRALPVNAVPSAAPCASDSYLVMLGQRYDGLDGLYSSPPPFAVPASGCAAGATLAEFLTMGERGLDLGTGLANIPVGTDLTFPFSANGITLASIHDGVPDILITQMADPAVGTDTLSLIDANGQVVGTAISVDQNSATIVGSWRADFYQRNGTGRPGSQFLNATRNTRFLAYELSQFGITAANYQQATALRWQASGSSDPVFFAFNEPSISIPTQVGIHPDQPSNYAFATPLNPPFEVAVRDGVGAIIPEAGTLIRASLASGSGTLEGTLSAATDANGVATFDDLRILGGDAHSLRFSFASLTPATSTALTCAISNAGGVAPPAEAGVYRVSSLDHLVWIASESSRWSASYLQTAAIDAATTAFMDCGLGWRPIGTLATPFTGTFDGGGHTIANLVIERGLDGETHAGLFGVIGEAGSVIRVGLPGVRVTGWASVGAVAALNEGTISESFATGTVASRASGIAYVGGLVGESSGSVRNSYASVAVQAAVGADVGGLVGRLTRVAGVSEAYATGTVSVPAGTGGGLIGPNSTGTVVQSFWDTQLSGVPAGDNVAFGLGKTTAELRNLLTFQAAGWDLQCESVNGSANVWGVDYDGGYPQLSAFGFDQNCRSLVLAVAPVGGASGQLLATPPVVEIRDANNNLVASATNAVTISLTDGEGGVLGPDLAARTVNAAGGVASFSGLTLAGIVGVNHTLRFSTPGLADAVAPNVTVSPGTPGQLSIAAGDAQSAAVGTAVDVPPSVLVRDAQGNPVPGVEVSFAVVTGGGSIAPTIPAVTGVDGVAALSAWTLGPSAGPNAVSATVSGSDLTVTFTATATPVLTTFAPASASAGERVTLTGGGLGAVTSVQFGGVEAFAFEVLSETEIAATVAYGSSGSVSISTAGGDASLTGFTFIPPIRYTFDYLPVGSVEGVDGWRTVPKGNSWPALEHMVLIPGVTPAGQNSTAEGHDGSRALRFPHGGAGIGALATRVNNANFSTLPILADDGHYVIEFEMQHPCWGGDFGLGFDADGNGDLHEANEIGLRLRVSNCTGDRRLILPNGSSVNAAHAVGSFNRYQILIDRAGNGGAGAVSVYTRNLTSGGAWTAIAGLQGINPGFDAGAGRSNPANWNAMLFRSESWDPASLLDNITFRKLTPSARSLNFATTLVGESASDSLVIAGIHLSGDLSATLSGDFTFADGTQSVAAIDAGAELSLRFVPSAAGVRSGSLTLAGDDHVGPIVIPLSGIGSEPYLDATTDGGGWVLVAYGADAALTAGARLTTRSGLYDPAVRTGSATLAAVERFQAGGEVAISWNRSGFPTDGIDSYEHAVAFPLPAPATMTVDGAAVPPIGPGATQFSRIGSEATQSLVPVRNLLTASADPGLPGSMFMRNQTLGVNYGRSYGLVWSPSNNQLDWTPDGQAFAAVYLGFDFTTPLSGYVTPAGTASGYVPSTMALWVRPARVSAQANGSELARDRSELLADGVDAANLSVQLRDAYGNAIARAGVPVRFATTLGSLSVAEPVLTDAFGIARAQLTSSEVGVASVTAEVDPEGVGGFEALANGSPQTVTVYPVGPADITPLAGTALIGAVGDEAGLLLSSFEHPRATGFGPGKATLAERFRTAAEEVWVTAAAFNVAGSPGVLSVDIREDAGGLPGAVVGTLGSRSVAPVAAGTFERVSIEGQGAVRLAANTDYWLTVRGDGSDPIYQQHSESPVVVAGPFARPDGSSSARFPVGGEAWTVSSANIVHALSTSPLVVVRDAIGNPLLGVSIDYSVEAGGGSLATAPTFTGSTNSDGLLAAPPWRFGNVAGAQRIRATLSNDATRTTTFNATATAGAAGRFLVASAESGNLAAGSSRAITVTALDALGNVATGYAGEKALIFSGASGAPGGAAPTALNNADTPVAIAFGESTALTFAAGVASTRLTLYKAETAAVAAADGSIATAEVDRLPVTVVVGDATQIGVAAGDSLSATVGTAVSTAPQVLVEDAFGNPVSGVDVVFVVAAGGGLVDPTTVVETDANGLAAVTSWTLGTTVGVNTLTATSGDLTGSPVTFSATGTAGAASAARSTLTPTSATLTANGAATQVLVVQPRDAFDNVVVDSNLTVAITRLSGAGDVGAVTYDVPTGTYRATVTAPLAVGVGTYVATLGGEPVQGGSDPAVQTVATLTYEADVPAALVFTSAAATQTAVLDTAVVTVALRDANGNEALAGAGGVTVTLSDGLDPARVVFRNSADSETITSVTIAEGESAVSFRATSRFADAYTVTANAGSGSLTATQVLTVTNVAPLLNPNGIGESDNTRMVTFNINQSDPRVPVPLMAPSSVNVSEADGHRFASVNVRIRESWLLDGADEVLRVAGGSEATDIPLAPVSGAYSGTVSVTVDAVVYTATLGELTEDGVAYRTVVFTRDEGEWVLADVEALLDALSYFNKATSPNGAGRRTFELSVTEDVGDGVRSNAVSVVITVGNGAALYLEPPETRNRSVTFTEGAGPVLLAAAGVNLVLQDDQASVDRLGIGVNLETVRDGDDEYFVIVGATNHEQFVSATDSPPAQQGYLRLLSEPSVSLGAATGTYGKFDYRQTTYRYEFVRIDGVLNRIFFTKWTGTGAGGALSLAEAQALIEGYAYVNTSDDPDESLRTLNFGVFSGGFGNTPAQAQITVVSVNDAPSGTNRTIKVFPTGAFTFGTSDFGFSDPDENQLKAVKITTLPVFGTLALSGTAVTPGQFISATEIGNLVYSTSAEAADQTFTFQVQDDGGTANGGVDLDPTPKTITFSQLVVAGIAEQVFTGAQISPTVSVTDGGRELTSGTDFTVSYGANVTVATGGTFTVIGAGAYAGAVGEFAFSILPAGSLVVVRENALASFTYSGEAQGPSVSDFVVSGSAGLVTVSYRGTDATVYGPIATAPTLVGSYEVIVSVGADANFAAASSEAFGFVIVPAVATVTAGDQSVVFGSPVVSVTDAGSVTVSGFVNSETDVVVSGLAGVTFTTTYTSATDAGTPGVTITPVVAGLSAANYTFVAVPGFITVVAKDAGALTIAPIADQVFTGSAITPTVVVTDGLITLVSGTDYSVEYVSNTAVGTASVIITFQGNYSGTASTSFTIAPGPVAKLRYAAQPSDTVAGVAMAPVVVHILDAFDNVVISATDEVSIALTTPAGAVLSGATTLAAVAGIVSFSDLAITEVGTYTFTATQGSLTLVSDPFAIAPAAVDVSVSTVEINPALVAADGSSAVMVTVTLKDAFGNVVTTPAQSVTLAAPSGTLNPASGSTVNGLFTAEFTTLTPGSVTIEAFLGVSISDAKIGQATLEAVDGSLGYRITGASSQAAGASQTIRVELMDGQGELVSAFAGTKTLIFAGASSVGTFVPAVAGTAFGTPVVVSFTDGVVSVPLVLYAAEVARISVTDGVIVSAAGDRLSVTVAPASANAATSSVSVSDTAVVSGGVVTVTVTLRDEFGNLFTAAVPSDFDISASDGELSGFTCTGGICSATFAAPTGPTTAQIGASLAGSPLAGSPIEVNVGAPPISLAVVGATTSNPYNLARAVDALQPGLALFALAVNPAGTAVSWAVNPSDVVSVSEAGVVALLATRPVGIDRFTITATALDGVRTASLDVILTVTASTLPVAPGDFDFKSEGESESDLIVERVENEIEEVEGVTGPVPVVTFQAFKGSQEEGADEPAFSISLAALRSEENGSGGGGNGGGGNGGGGDGGWTPIPLEEGKIQAEENGGVWVGGNNFEPGTLVTAWIESDPQLLGVFTVRSDGAFGGIAPLPNDLRAGSHTLRITGTTFDSVRRTFAVGVAVAQRLDSGPGPIVEEQPEVDTEPEPEVVLESGMSVTLAVRNADAGGAFATTVVAASGDRLEFRFLYAAIGNAPVRDVVLRTDLHRALLFALGATGSPLAATLTCPDGGSVNVAVTRDAPLVLDLAERCSLTALAAGSGGEVRFFVSVP
jgi:hypothetical protein